MSRINYSNNPTDCNYSFCDEKENIPPNQDELTRILKRHYHLHLKNAHTMRQQASQIERMQIALTSIQRQLSQNHSISTISHYASGHSAYHQQSIEFFPNKHTSRGKSKGSSSKSNSNGSYYRHSKPQQSSRQSSTNKSQRNSSERRRDGMLLSSIVERKLNIEKELKERLLKHLLPSKSKETHYITYATER